MTDQLVTGQSTALDVPAVRGDGVTVGVAGIAQDGWGVSGESKKQVGVRGFCVDGWGVAGESENQVGVRGFCAPGWGVAGESVTNAGVLGKSNSGSGVIGSSTTGDGVVGQSYGTGRGVVGVSDNHTGVEGNSRKGSGIFGSSQDNPGVEGHSIHGAGIFGQGNPAGYFEGNVTVTGDITVKAVSFLSLVYRIQQLEAQVSALMQRLSASSSLPSGSGSAPFIGASLALGTNGGIENQVLTVSGGGFMPLEPVTIKVVQTVNHANPSSHDMTTTADSLGMMNKSESVTCAFGQTTFEVTATGNSSHKTSNVAGASC